MLGREPAEHTVALRSDGDLSRSVEYRRSDLDGHGRVGEEVAMAQLLGPPGARGDHVAFAVALVLDADLRLPAIADRLRQHW